MKTLILVSVLASLNFAQAKTREFLNCKAVEVVNSSYLEESLSVEEYPEVTLGRDEEGNFEAWLGSSAYKTEDGDLIGGEASVGFDLHYSILPDHKLQKFYILITGGPVPSPRNEGKLYGQSRKQKSKKFGKLELIAKLICK